MSPLWRDQLRIVLCPDKVIIVRLGRGLRPSIVDKQTIHCEPTAGLPAWRAPLDRLAQWLAGTEQKMADVVVILSNHFVRYGVLPWVAGLDNAREELAFARIHFEKIYGAFASHWSLRISDGPYETPRLVSAMDQDLLDALLQRFAGTKLPLRSIQPYLMSAFNPIRKRLHKQSGLFVLVEPGKACVALLADGKWRDVKNLVLRSDAAEELAAVLRREMLQAGLDANTKLYLHVAENPTLHLNGMESSSVKVLSLPAHADVRFGMAEGIM